MALKKTIAGHWVPVNKIVQNEDGTVSHINGKEWVEQQEVEMHPLEEAEIIAHWNVGESERNRPQKPTREEEHEWLIEHGADYVKQKRAEWQQAHDKWLKGHQPIVDAHRAAANAYEAWANAEHERILKEKGN